LGAEDIIVTTLDKIPSKKIVKVLGVVHDSRIAWISAKNCVRKIIEEIKWQAWFLGADAIINLKIQPTLLGFSGTGTAVKLEDEQDHESGEELEKL